MQIIIKKNILNSFETENRLLPENRKLEAKKVMRDVKGRNNNTEAERKEKSNIFRR